MVFIFGVAVGAVLMACAATYRPEIVSALHERVLYYWERLRD